MENKKEIQKIDELKEKNERFSSEVSKLFEEMYAAKAYGWNKELQQCQEEFEEGRRQINRKLQERKNEIEKQRMEEC